MMTPELKDRWLSALRSGEYAQGQHALCNGDEFCCLGVLADVMDEPDATFDRDLGKLQPPEGPTLRCTLGEALETRFFKGNKAGLVEHVFSDRCWKMNDDEGKSFEEIADWLEENL